MRKPAALASAMYGFRSSIVGLVLSTTKRCFASIQARQQKLLAMARPQHVQIDTNVGIKHVPAVESGLARGLNADKNDRFHSENTRIAISLQKRVRCVVSAANRALRRSSAGVISSASNQIEARNNRECLNALHPARPDASWTAG